MRAMLWTGTGTGPARPSWPTSISGGTRFMSRSRTGSTTSTSGPWSATRTRSSPLRSTSSGADAGTAGGRWSQTGTNMFAITPTPGCSPGGLPVRGWPWWGSTSFLVRSPSTTSVCPSAAFWFSVRRVPALRCDAVRVRPVVPHHPVRQHPFTQRRSRVRHRHVRLVPPTPQLNSRPSAPTAPIHAIRGGSDTNAEIRHQVPNECGSCG